MNQPHLGQGCRKHLKLGGTTLREHFFLKKKGTISMLEKRTSLFIVISWGGMCFQCPRFLVPMILVINCIHQLCCRPLQSPIHLLSIWHHQPSSSSPDISLLSIWQFNTSSYLYDFNILYQNKKGFPSLLLVTWSSTAEMVDPWATEKETVQLTRGKYSGRV